MTVLPAPWMTANSCGLRTLARTISVARDDIDAVAGRIAALVADTAAQLGWWGRAAQAASALGQERAAQLRAAAAAAQDLIDAATRLADGMDHHSAALHELTEQAQALDAAGAAGADPQEASDARLRAALLEEQVQGHVEALAALDRLAAETADEAFRRLSGLLQQIGRVHWLGGITRVAVGYAAQQTGALALPEAAAGAGSDGSVSWPFENHLGDSPSCGDNATAAEKVCSTANGLVTGTGVLTGGVDALTKQAQEARRILTDPGASGQERAWASRLLADVGEYEGAARIVQIGSDARYVALAGKAAPVAGGLLAGWAGYAGEVDKGQPVHVALAVAATEGAADTVIGWGAVAAGAEIGGLAGSAVPVVGTAIGGIVGAGGGALVAYFASNEVNSRIAGWWEHHPG